MCIIQTLKVCVTEFNQVSEEHAFKEGEGDWSLDYWRKVHVSFLTNEFASVNRFFTRIQKWFAKSLRLCTNKFQFDEKTNRDLSYAE